MPIESLSERFWEKVDRSGGSKACWVWLAAIKPDGYAAFWVSAARKTRSAHLVLYEATHGAVPSGLTLDHLCRNRACVNPAHLEVVTRGENVLRGIGPTAVNARKTHCPKNHPLQGENLYVDGNGKRSCLICRAATARAWFERNRLK